MTWKSRRSTWLPLALAAILALAAFASFAMADDDRDGRDRDDRGRFTFGLWGDMPYTTVDAPKIPALIADMNAARLAFSVFDGDIKSGSTFCTDDVYTAAIARFNAFSAPMIYVPGDNEWTDCHRTNNGGFNALERLDFIRR